MSFYLKNNKKGCTKISDPPLSPGFLSSDFYHLYLIFVAVDAWVCSSKIHQDDLKPSSNVLMNKTVVSMKDPSVSNYTIPVVAADQCGFLPRQILRLTVRLVSPYGPSSPVSAQGESLYTLINIGQHVPVLETDIEILQMVDAKNLPSHMCSSIDKPMRIFPQKEIVDYLLRTHKPKNVNSLRAYDTGNSD